MKEVKLTERDLLLIRSNAINIFVDENKGAYTNIYAIIQSFIDFCNKNNYTVHSGKVYSNEEEKEKSSKTV